MFFVCWGFSFVVETWDGFDALQRAAERSADRLEGGRTVQRRAQKQKAGGEKREKIETEVVCVVCVCVF